MEIQWGVELGGVLADPPHIEEVRAEALDPRCYAIG